MSLLNIGLPASETDRFWVLYWAPALLLELKARPLR
uniref:Uncharacterized protein n=1 Tax=Anguilla anguilla TaxID=7936 RepID=A0A0E9UF72_ANGAN